MKNNNLILTTVIISLLALMIGCKSLPTNEVAAEEGKKLAAETVAKYAEGKSLLSDGAKTGNTQSLEQAHTKLSGLSESFQAATKKYDEALAGNPPNSSQLHTKYSKLSEAYKKFAEPAKIAEQTAIAASGGSGSPISSADATRANNLEKEINQLVNETK